MAARRPLTALAVLALLASPAAAGPTVDPNAPLTPPPALTPMQRPLTAIGTPADGKPLPTVIPAPLPQPPPPMSPPGLAAPVSDATPAVAPPVAVAPRPAAEAKPAAEPKPVARTTTTATRKPERAVRYAATEINVRPRPSNSARRIDIIDEGTALEVIGPLIDGKWVKVARHGEILGYVVAEYLLTHPPAPH